MPGGGGGGRRRKLELIRPRRLTLIIIDLTNLAEASLLSLSADEDEHLYAAPQVYRFVVPSSRWT